MENKLKDIKIKSTTKSNGITLIALVITIVVLLILAGVSIAMLTGNNGIITQAKLAKENTDLAKEEEKNKLSNNNEYINEQTGNAVPGKIVTETKKDNYVDSEGNQATIPAGFTVSKIPGEEKVAEGLVIYDIPEADIENVDWTTKNEAGAYNVQTLYNQFVWIPVQSEDEYQREFSYPSRYHISDTWTTLEITPENSTFTDIGYLPSKIRPEVDTSETSEIAERSAVLKYNGFYISRYEAGKENLKVVSKQNAIVYVNETQESFKSIGLTMYEKNNVYVKSAMCSGIQWDMLMKFVDEKKDSKGNVYNVRKQDSDRHIGNKTKSGQNLADRVQNIYDIEGNCIEYTAEKNNNSDPIVFRGGNSIKSSFAISSMRNGSMGKSDINTTFRPVIYIM